MYVKLAKLNFQLDETQRASIPQRTSMLTGPVWLH